MPAEWEPHRLTWLAWPTNKITWPGDLLRRTESVYLQIISALLPHEKVNLLVKDKKTAQTVLKTLAVQNANTSNLIFYKARTVDAWIRDYGPIFVKRVIANRGEASVKQSEWVNQIATPRPADHARNDMAFTKWIFNAWGGRYSDLAKDNEVVDRLEPLKKIRRFDTGLVLEGGSIDVNGKGTCLTTEQCLLNSNRNPKLSRGNIEKKLKDYLGAVKVIWLKAGIQGDDTDGHVDDIARFVNTRTVVTAIENDRADPNYSPLKKNIEILRSAKDLSGKRFRIIELPMPERIYSGNKRLPASYANFYIANRVVLVPVYHHQNDKRAIKIIKSIFPGRNVVGIECTALVHGLGSIHCVTQQEPY